MSTPTMNRTWTIMAGVAGMLLLAVLLVAGVLFTSAYDKEEVAYVYLKEGDNAKQAIHDAGVRSARFNMLSSVIGYRVRPGRYAVSKGDNIFSVFRRLRNGQQEPVNLTLPSLRTMNDLAGFLGDHLLLDSADVANAFADSTFTATYGYTPQTLPALFIPNTYQVYWNVSLDDFMQRMVRENAAFWTKERDAKAQDAGFTHEEIMTLASIVDEETANNAEKPMVAGMYIKRLQTDMPLQADPTVKFAVGDFSLRRILHAHLKTDSPYNTYLYEGLPPGPIRIPSIAGIDAVLNYVHHDYVYMCAKEDFSGTHNFAATYGEHMRNARRYAKALDERGIK